MASTSRSWSWLALLGRRDRRAHPIFGPDPRSRIIQKLIMQRGGMAISWRAHPDPSLPGSSHLALENSFQNRPCSLFADIPDQIAPRRNIRHVGHNVRDEPLELVIAVGRFRSWVGSAAGHWQALSTTANSRASPLPESHSLLTALCRALMPECGSSLNGRCRSHHGSCCPTGKVFYRHNESYVACAA